MEKGFKMEMMYKFEEVNKLEKLIRKSNIDETIALFRPEYQEYLSKDERFRFGNDGDKKTELFGVNMFDVEARLAERFAKAYEDKDRGAIDDIPTYWGDKPGLNAITLPGGINSSSSHKFLRKDYLDKIFYPYLFNLSPLEKEKLLKLTPTDMSTSYNLGNVIDNFERTRPEGKTTELYDRLIKAIIETNNNLFYLTTKILNSSDYNESIKECERKKGNSSYQRGFSKEDPFRKAMKAYHDEVFNNHRLYAIYHARSIEKIYKVASDITTGIST